MKNSDKTKENLVKSINKNVRISTRKLKVILKIRQYQIIKK